MSAARRPPDPYRPPAGYEPAGTCPDCGATLYRTRYEPDCHRSFSHLVLMEGLWHPPTWTLEADSLRRKVARTGPRPAHLREIFDQQIESWDGAGPRWAGLRERGRLAYFHGEAAARWARLPTDAHCWRWLLGELADCTDTMPVGTCERLGLPPGSTYHDAFEALRDEAARIQLYTVPPDRYQYLVDVAARVCEQLTHGLWQGRLDVVVAKDAAGRHVTSAQIEAAIRAEARRREPLRPMRPLDLGQLSVELAGITDEGARFVITL